MAKRKDPFAIDISFNLTSGGKKEKTGNKSKLTQTQKNKIKNLVGQCEMSNCDRHPHEVHHIKWLNKSGTDTYSNLIVLCGACHDDAHGKNPTGKQIPLSTLRGIVKRRSKTKAEGIKNILKGVGTKPQNSKKDPFDMKFGF